MSRPYTPRPYQLLANDFLSNTPRGALWAGMGLGKTVATLTALDALFLTGEDQPALVTAPLRVARKVWSDEIAKWNHLRHVEISTITGTVTERIAALRRSASVYTINYENLPWLMKHLDDTGRTWPFGTVVADESTKLKSFRLRQGGKRAHALGAVAHRHVKHWWNLTGTPSPNGLQDLWGQTWYLDRGARLGSSFEAFKQRWFQKSFDGYSITPLPYAQEQITERLQDICLSIDPADWFDLQAPIVNNIYVDLPSKAMSLYKDMEKKMFAEIQGHEVEAFNAASRTIKCLQLANGAAYIDEAGNWKETHTAKLEAVEDILEEAAGMPVMVAYHFKSDLARLCKAFPQGRQLKTAKDEDDWNAGRIPLLFAHPASMGHGLSLQDGGNILAFFGHWWDLEQYQQIIERIGPVRQLQAGHNRPVFIHHIIARGTVDELVMARRDTKRTVQDLLMQYTKGRIPA